MKNGTPKNGQKNNKAARAAKTVVIADDDPELRLVLMRWLSAAGFNVCEAEDGDRAYELIVREKPQLAVLDVMMPGLSGWEVCKKVRQNARLRGTKLLMLTGIGERLNDMTSPLFGADATLDKPFTPDELEESLQTLLGGPKGPAKSARERATTRPMRIATGRDSA